MRLAAPHPPRTFDRPRFLPVWLVPADFPTADTSHKGFDVRQHDGIHFHGSEQRSDVLFNPTPVRQQACWPSLAHAGGSSGCPTRHRPSMHCRVRQPFLRAASYASQRQGPIPSLFRPGSAALRRVLCPASRERHVFPNRVPAQAPLGGPIHHNVRHSGGNSASRPEAADCVIPDLLGWALAIVCPAVRYALVRPCAHLRSVISRPLGVTRRLKCEQVETTAGKDRKVKSNKTN